jgi:hypothetical protein
MIGMNDDTRFLTENRHGQLLAEAETRRLAAGEDADDRTGIGVIAHRLGSRLFGRRPTGVTETSMPAELAPATRLSVASRKPSVGGSGEPCSGNHVHERAAA